MISQSILIIDDDPVVRHILGSILTGKGFAVQEAITGARGIELLRAAFADNRSPSLASVAAAFVDMMLMDINGGDIAKEIKQKLSPQLPVVIISANSEQELKQLSPGVLYDAFLPKPFDADGVSTVLAKIGLKP